MLELERSEAGLVLRDGPESWELVLPDGKPLALVHAAAGVVCLAPPSPGRERALELLEAGGEDALALAAAVVKRVLE